MTAERAAGTTGAAGADGGELADATLGANPSPERSRMRLLGSRRGVGLAAVAALLLLLTAPSCLGAIGHWLVVSDELAPAEAIFVHAGRVPFRAIEAARIYNDGFAPEVWLADIAPTMESAALARLGIERHESWFYNKKVLEAMGVPSEASRRLDQPVLNTYDEIQSVVGELQRLGARRVILVTSMQHTRRVRAVWRALADDQVSAIVRPTRRDSFDPDGWWRNTTDIKAVFVELVGLVNVGLGFPLRPEQYSGPGPAHRNPSQDAVESSSNSFGGPRLASGRISAKRSRTI